MSVTEEELNKAANEQTGRVGSTADQGQADFPYQWLSDLLALGVLKPYQDPSTSAVTGYTWAETGETKQVEGQNEDGETEMQTVPVTFGDELLEGINDWLTTQGAPTAINLEAGIEIIQRRPAELDTIFSSIYEIAAKEYSVLVDGENIVVHGADLERASTLVPGTTIEDAFLAVRSGARHDVPWETLLMAARRPRTGGVAGSGESLDVVARKMQAAEKRFGSELMAYLHVAGEGELLSEGPPGQASRGRSLAEAVSEDVPNLSGDEYKQLLGIMKPLNLWNNDPITAMVQSQKEMDFLNGLEAGSSSPAPIENPYSKDTVDDQLRGLYQSWFQLDPTETELEDFRNHFTDQLSAYQQQEVPSDNPFMKGNQAGIVAGRPTLESASRTYLRAQPLYGDLYANKPGGVNEETYMGQMQGAATRWLGPQAMNAGDAVRAGLRSGDTADVQRNIRSSGLGDDSPVYKNRLAGLGQALRRAD